MTNNRSRRATWGPMAMVAPASLAFLAGMTVWVGAHDPRSAALPLTPVSPWSPSTASMPTRSLVTTAANAAMAARFTRLEKLLTLTEKQVQQWDGDTKMSLEITARAIAAQKAAALRAKAAVLSGSPAGTNPVTALATSSAADPAPQNQVAAATVPADTAVQALPGPAPVIQAAPVVQAAPTPAPVTQAAPTPVPVTQAAPPPAAAPAAPPAVHTTTGASGA